MPPHVIARSLATACAVAISLPTLAETNPWYLGASVGITHESNLFRSSTGAVGDTVVVSSILAGLDQPFGRQRARANVSLRDNRYQNRSDLDYQGYGVGAALDWSTIGNLSGTIELNANQTMAQFNQENAPDIRKRNVQRNQALSASARLGVVTRLTLDASFQASDLRYSAPEFDFRELKQSSFSVGGTYAFSSALSFGASVGLGKGEYPFFTPTSAETYDTDFFSIRAVWQPTGNSRLRANLSQTDRTFDRATQNAYRGLTGAVAWDWRLGGRTSVSARLSRDVGNDAQTFVVFGPITGELEQSRVTNGLTLSGNYQLSGKIGLKANLGYFNRSVADTRTIGNNTGAPLRGKDRSTNVGLGANWAPTRSLSVGCDLGYQQRRSADFATLAYRNESIACFVQGVIQ